MVNNTIHATYTETYDLNTINDELSILAIHTPQSNTLKRFFHGLYEQYRKMKVLGCNFKMVCASQQALDPTLVGMAEGQVDPRDVLNPILFKAVTGEGVNALIDQIYNAGESVTPTVGNSSNLGHSIDQHVISSTGGISAYYSLLADDSWRREHPQRGITVMGLKPMVHRVVTTQPFKWSASQRATGAVVDVPQVAASSTPGSQVAPYGFGGVSGSSDGSTDPVNPTVFVSNGLTEMPWLDTAFSSVHTYADGTGATQGSSKAYALQTNIPRVYMGCLVLPPSTGTQNLYYRLQIVWHILFRDFRTAQDLLPITPGGPFDTDTSSQDGMGLEDRNGYFNLYHTSSKLAKDYGSFDTTGIDSVTEVMQKGQ